MNVRGGNGERRRRPAWLGALLGIVLVLKLIAAVARTAQSDSSYSSSGLVNSGPQPGVQVCAYALYSFYSSEPGCLVNEDSFTTTDAPEMVFTGPNGANFTSTTVAVTIKVEDSNRKVLATHKTTLEVDTNNNVAARPVQFLLLSAGVEFKPGTLYELDLRQGAESLGSVSFSVTKSALASGGVTATWTPTSK